MGLYYDRKRKYLHSISKDRKYRVLNLRKGELVAGTNKSILLLDIED